MNEHLRFISHTSFYICFSLHFEPKIIKLEHTILKSYCKQKNGAIFWITLCKQEAAVAASWIFFSSQFSTQAYTLK